MKKLSTEVGFHNAALASSQVRPYFRVRQDTEFTYTFESYFHPYVGALIEQLNKKSLAGMLDPKFLQDLATPFFETFYDAKRSDVVKFTDFPQKDIDLRDGGPYANYNWELLFHVPLTIAVHLSKNQRFAEAQRWFHYIFDPTSTDASVDPPIRYWKFLRFRQESDVQQIDELLALLSKPDDECTDTELDLKGKIQTGYDAIMSDPFKPHKVARTRTVAYQFSVVMKYLDNLIAWGDSLFMQDTIESINEATQCYVLAANLLGPRPEQVPLPGTVRPRSFAQLKASNLDKIGNALVELEAQFPFNLSLPQSGNATGNAGSGNDGSGQTGPLFSIGRTLYFCIPRNDKLLGYWDTVADRLFKIRHCMNIQGVVRQLALFDPPIDPGMLVKAAAAGINIGSIVSGLNQPVSPVRCTLLIQKALEVCAEVRGLGNSLLSALEKGDGEHISLLRQSHEIKLQQLSQDVRFLQWKHAQEATEGLLRSRASALERYHYYERLLGFTPDTSVAPDTLPLDRRELTEENFDEAYSSLVGQYEKAIAVQPLPPLKLAGDSSPSNQSGATGQSNLYLNTGEDAELNQHLPAAKSYHTTSFGVRQSTPVLSLIPDFPINLHFWGLGGTITIGGTAITRAATLGADILELLATRENQDATSTGKTGSYARRVDDWTFQNNLAVHELVQNGRQIIASLIAEQVAHHEYLNAQAQIANSQEVDRFLQEKFSNEELYAWMQGEASRLYYEYYRFAFDTARKAERTMKQELMRPELDTTDFIQFNYWDGGRKGLLSGEALYLDVKRMELAYYENNKREFEITRHVSLRQLDPLALLTLKATGRCEVSIPEWLYDRDCPGHYMRRIKSVALSVPAVVGPYTSINCTLSLLRSTIRKSSLLRDGEYARSGASDDRFVDYFGSVQSIVTSGGNNDSGLFETNLRDERFLPFEGAGAVSTWRLELPSDFRPFDYMTSSDVILHIRYTARQGGDLLGKQALTEMREMLSSANQSGPTLLFSLRHDFPTEWSAFVNSASDFTARLRKDYFPYMVQSEPLAIDSLELFAVEGNKLNRRVVDVPANLSDELNGAQRESTLSIPADAANEHVLARNASAQVFLMVRYHLDF